MISFVTVVGPVVVGMALLLPVAALPARWLVTRACAAFVTVAVAAAYVVGHALIFPGWMSFPPADAVHWVLYAAAAAGLLAACAELLPAPARLMLRLACCAALPVLVPLRTLREEYSILDALLLIADVAALTAAAIAVCAGVQRRLGSVAMFNLGWTAASSAVVFGLTGSIKLAQLAGALGLAVGGVWLLNVLLGLRGTPGAQLRRTASAAAALPITVTLAALLLAAWFYGDTPGRTVAHLAAAPLFGGLALGAPLGGAGPAALRRRRLALCIGLTLLPLAAAIADGVARFNSTDEGDSSETARRLSPVAARLAAAPEFGLVRSP